MALLHDIGRCEEYASGKSHHEAGAELARPILLACGYTEHECAEICDAIGRHKAPSEQARSLATCCMMRISSLETVLTAPCRNSVTGQRKRRTIQFDIKFHIQEECSREKNGCFFVYDGCKEIDKKQNLIKTTAN